MNRRIEVLDETHAQAREYVMEALRGARDEDEDRLIRWIFEEGINPYDVFLEHDDAAAFNTFEGIHGIMLSLAHALRDDGEVSFINTKVHGPRIVFADHKEKAFNEIVRNTVISAGHGDNLVEGFLDYEVLDGVDALMEAHQQHEKWRNRLNEMMEAYRASGSSGP